MEALEDLEELGLVKVHREENIAFTVSVHRFLEIIKDNVEAITETIAKISDESPENILYSISWTSILRAISEKRIKLGIPSKEALEFDMDYAYAILIVSIGIVEAIKEKKPEIYSKLLSIVDKFKKQHEEAVLVLS